MFLQLIGYFVIMLISTIIIVRRVAMDSSKSPADFLQQPSHVRQRLRFWTGIASAALWSGIASVSFGTTFAIFAFCCGLYFGRRFFRMFVKDEFRRADKVIRDPHEIP